MDKDILQNIPPNLIILYPVNGTFYSYLCVNINIIRKNMKNKILLTLPMIAQIAPAFASDTQAQSPEANKRPNIVWIVSEDNAKHYMRLFDEHGIATPAIESLAADGITYPNCYSNAAVSSAARSTLITGCYGPRMMSHYHRHIQPAKLPAGVKMFPAYLRNAGYYTVNHAKKDYNVVEEQGVWDESSPRSTWRKRKEGQPFFYVHNLATTHESRVHFTKDDFKNKKTKHDPSKAFVQPNFPQTDLFRYTAAVYQDKIAQMDGQVGDILAQLKKDNLMDNTIIFYYGDNGGVLPDSKGYLTETGLNVPLVVYIPKQYKHLFADKKGTTNNAFVSFVDFAPTVLNLANVRIPKIMNGRPFLGKNVDAKEVAKRDTLYGYADRFDEKYDMDRSVRIGNMKYVRHFMPYIPDALMNSYRYKQLAYQEWKQLFARKELQPAAAAFFKPQRQERLYDLSKDPYELNDLSQDKAYAKQLKSLRKALSSWQLRLPDLSFVPEFALIAEASENPIAYGKKNFKVLSTCKRVADFQLWGLKTAEKSLPQYFNHENPWVRHWAAITAASFGKRAKAFVPALKKMLKDSERVNRVQAEVSLAIIAKRKPTNMTKELYATKDMAESLLILNNIVLLRDAPYQFKIPVDYKKIHKPFQSEYVMSKRIEYLCDVKLDLKKKKPAKKKK